MLPTAVQCPEHFGIWKAGQRLTSVGRIVGLYPSDPCSQCHWPIYSDHMGGCSVKANIDNANVRGKAVEALLTSYLAGTLRAIPAGTRFDVRDLFLKAKGWFDKQGFRSIQSQVLLSDEDTGGVADFICDGMILDLKTVHSLSETHGLQVGGYMSLHGSERGALLHITERKEPTLRIVDVQARYDFRELRHAYRVIQRLGGVK